MIAATTMALNVTASADTPKLSPQYTILTVDEMGNPTSGVVTFSTESIPDELNAPKVFSFPGTTNESVGGGDWSYGWRWVNLTTKECFSNYMHRSSSHTATATMGSETNTATARSGNWAKALVKGGVTSGTCNAYWSTQ
ncbi:hypothetical protein J2S37_002725 [Corynebacterium felinum]|uniref:Lactococcin 972 family bacteriocin n=3 Tax=Corynebacterium felinum TaxID=131318 RepID=A0ABU2BC25_9CORY|nr:hypothetical protein [Corynebacterium felinum]